MATAYANDIPAPAFMEADGRFDYDAYQERCRQYEADTEAFIRTELGGKHKYTGRIIRFPVADGYAQYMLWTPTKWIHLDEVDGYHADPALIRGMRTQDVIARVEADERFAEIWAGR